MPKPASATPLGAVVRPLAEMLEARGFAKRALVFTRTRGEVQTLLSVQRSMSNSAELGRFYVNIGLVFARVGALDPDRSGNVVIGGVGMHVAARLEQLVPAAPAAWDVDPTTDAVAMGQRLRTLTTPVLDQLDDVVDGPSALTAWPGPWGVTRAQLLYLARRDDEARRALDQLVAFFDRPPITVAWFATKHHMPRLLR